MRCNEVNSVYTTIDSITPVPSTDSTGFFRFPLQSSAFPAEGEKRALLAQVSQNPVSQNAANNNLP
jgi:hypothetical protein